MFLLNEEKVLDDYIVEPCWDEIPTKEFIRTEQMREALKTAPVTPIAIERAAWREVWAEDTVPDGTPLPVDDDPWSRYIQEEDDIGGRG